MNPTAAWAVTIGNCGVTKNGADFQYAGQWLDSTQTPPLGLERHINVSFSLVNNLNTDHILFYLEAKDSRTSCDGKGSCYLQLGHGAGQADGSVTVSQIQQVYWEYAASDGNGFHGGFLPSTVSLGQNDFFNVFDTGLNFSGTTHPIYQAFQNSTMRLQEPITGISNRVSALTEGAKPSVGSEPYPQVDAVGGLPAGFGLNNSMQHDSGWSLYKTYAANPSNWLEWVTPPSIECTNDDGHGNGQPYDYAGVYSWSSFNTYGPGTP